MSMMNLIMAMYVLFRAGVAGLLEGVHGTGKTSVIYSLWAKIALEREEITLEEYKSISSVGIGKFFQTQEYRPDRFWIWSFSAANIMIDEIIGYADKHRPWEEADALAWRTAASMASNPTEVGEHYKVIMANIMEERGITEADRGQTKLNYLRSSQFLPPETHTGGGIFFPDELNLSSPQVERALMSIMLEDRFLDFTMPDGIWKVSSQNPPTANYHAREMNPPTLDRFCRLAVKTSLNETIQVFSNLGFNDVVQEALADHGDEMHNVHEAEVDFEVDTVCNNRGLDFASRILNVIEKHELEKVGLKLLQGVVGQTAGAAIHKKAMNRKDTKLNINEIFKGYGVELDTYDPKSTWPQDIKDTPVRRKVKMIANKATVRADLLEPVLRNALRFCTEINKKTVDEFGNDFKKYKHSDADRLKLLNLMVFLTDIPSDFTRRFLFSDIQDARAFEGSIGTHAHSKLGKAISQHASKKAKENGIDVKSESGNANAA
jgi:hypothetical protein